MSDCDFDNPCEAVLADKTRKCRKPRRCCECRTMIERGEHYNYYVAIWEGELSAYSTCLKCMDLRKRCEFRCAGIGELAEYVSQCGEVDIETLAFISRRERYTLERMKQ